MDHLPKSVQPPGLDRLLPQQSDWLLARYPDVRLPYPIDPARPEEQRSGLLEYWFTLRKHKGLMTLVALAGSMLGYLVTLPQTPIYQAHTSVEIENLNPNFLNIKEVNPVTQTSASSETSDIPTQIKLLQSSALLERVVSKMQGRTAPQPPGRMDTWRKLLRLPSPPAGEAANSALQMAVRTVKTRAAGATRIIEITVDSTDPLVASAFANTLTSEYIEQNLESRWNTTQRTTEWLTHQLDDVRIKLEQSEDRLQQYARDAGLLFTDEKTRISEEKLTQIQAALSAVQAELVAKQSRFETASSSPPETLPDVLSDETLREYKTKLVGLHQQIAELSATYTPEYPKVKRLEAQTAVIEADFARERGAILKRIRNEYEETLRRERLLAASYAQQAKVVAAEGERGIQYGILKREVDSNRQLYDTMLQQLKQATIASALRASNVRVVDAAKPAARPYKPNPIANAALGLISGLFLGAAFIVMRERADRSIKEPGDSPHYLGVPELGIIPSASVAGRKQRLLPGNPPETVELVTWQQKTSGLAEAFRSTLVSTVFSGQNGSRPRVIVMTSAGPGEGKSTVSANLATAMTEAGDRVLVVDGDLRKPRMHAIFGIDNSAGLSDLLRGDAKDIERWAVIFETDIPNLFLLPSGKATSAATSLLYGTRTTNLIQRLRAEFDMVIIDTPPMLQIPDARVLGRLADKVIMVVRSGITTRDAAIAALQKFKEDGTPVLGTILNYWDPKHSPVGYYGYYGKYYQQYEQHYQG